MSNVDLFAAEYRRVLLNHRTANPTMYAWRMEMFDTICDRLINAAKEGRMSLDGPVARQVLVNLGIKRTYKSLKDYLYA